MAADKLEAVTKKVSEKLDEPVERLIGGKHDEHDFLPAFMWVLLERGKQVETSIQSLRNSISEQLGDFKKELFAELKGSNEKVVVDVIARLDKALTGLQRSTDDLAQTLRTSNTDAEARARALRAAIEQVGQRVTNAANQITTETARNQAELSVSFGNHMKRLRAIVIAQGVTVILVLAALILLR